jgi:photosystem II stability/assembly factor-like uncharacterized protein
MPARMRIGTLLLFVVVGLISLPATARAQWEQTDGPEGPAINGFVMIEGHLFAATTKGLYASTDGGYHWTALAGFLGKTNISIVDCDEQNLYAVTDSGLCVSSDLGGSWHVGGQGLLSSPLAFTHLGDRLFAATMHGVCTSSDAGRTWSADTAGLESLTWDLAVVEGRLFAATTTGLFMSADSGATWASTSGRADGGSVDYLSVLGSDLFAYSFLSNSLSKSTDFGTTWTTVYDQNAVDPYGNVGFVTPADSVLYLGARGKQWPFVWRSTDGGTTWSRTSFQYDYLFVYAGIAAGQEFLVGTNKGVFRTDDGGASWWSSNAGMTTSSVYALSVRNGRILCGTAKTIFSSDTDGDRWIFDGGGSSAIVSYSSDWDGNVLGIAAIGDATVLSTLEGIYISRCPHGRYGPADDQGPRSRLCVLGTKVFGIDTVHIFRSDDTCRSWQVADGEVQQPLAVTAGGGTLFVGTRGHGAFSSSDCGTTWTRLGGGLPDTLTVTAIETDGSTTILGTAAAVYRSDDGGSHWTQVTDGLATVLPVKTFALDGQNIYAGTGHGVYRLSDGESAWSPLNDGMGSDLEVAALVVHNSSLYAGTLGGGVWRQKLALSQMTTAIAERPTAFPGSATLQQNYPNPFNPSTTVSYHVARAGQVRLTVYDILGREVQKLVDEYQREGSYSVRFDAGHLSSGTYLCRLETGGTSSVRKMTLMK